MNGAKDINKEKYKRIKGSSTVEAAIAMPIFIMVIFSLAFLFRIYYAYNMVQMSLSNVARGIANMSYFYHVSGAKDYADELNKMAVEANNTLEEQKKTIINAFDAFNDLVSNASSIGTSSSVDTLIDSIINANDAANDLSGLIKTVLDNPREELKLLMTVFGKKLSYELTNKVVCLIARNNLAIELKKLVKSNNNDVALTLGITDGIAGMNFDESSIFGDGESLEFVVRYSVKPPKIFGLAPEVQLCNRVKVIAWTGGRGNKSIKAAGEKNDSPDKAQESIWNDMDKNKDYMDRGLTIEKLYIDELTQKNNSKGVKTFETSSKTGMDAFTYDEKTGIAEYYDIFTLNPFMKTYQQRPGAIASEIKKHGKKLLDCTEPEYLENVNVSSVKRIVVFVVPENSDQMVDEAYAKAKKELEPYDIEVVLIKGYGQYTPKENENQDEAA
ncbi:MAG: pilus assembly protein [Clostridiaceae bacterium]|nr:pilus assembly protein [Clostridiaceae bacterium]